jgi:hypothetical protein
MLSLRLCVFGASLQVQESVLRFSAFYLRLEGNSTPKNLYNREGACAA